MALTPEQLANDAFCWVEKERILMRITWNVLYKLATGSVWETWLGWNDLQICGSLADSDNVSGCKAYITQAKEAERRSPYWRDHTTLNDPSGRLYAYLWSSGWRWEGALPVESSHTLKIPRWSFNQWCLYHSNDEKYGEWEAEPPDRGLMHSQSAQMASPGWERKAKPPNQRFMHFQITQTASRCGEQEAEPPNRGLMHSQSAQTDSPDWEWKAKSPNQRFLHFRNAQMAPQCGEQDAEPPNRELVHSWSAQTASPGRERKAKPPNWRFMHF
jgi:hypothetical protein